MNDTNIYLIQLNGQIELRELNANSPLELEWLASEPDRSSFLIHTDQSGLMGMLRFMHARGLVILLVTCNSKGE